MFVIPPEGKAPYPTEATPNPEIINKQDPNANKVTTLVLRASNDDGNIFAKAITVNNTRVLIVVPKLN